MKSNRASYHQVEPKKREDIESDSRLLFRSPKLKFLQRIFRLLRRSQFQIVRWHGSFSGSIGRRLGHHPLHFSYGRCQTLIGKEWYRTAVVKMYMAACPYQTDHQLMTALWAHRPRAVGIAPLLALFTLCQSLSRQSAFKLILLPNVMPLPASRWPSPLCITSTVIRPLYPVAESIYRHNRAADSLVSLLLLWQKLAE